MNTGRILLITGLVAIGVIIFINKCNNKTELSPRPGAKALQPMMVNAIIVTPVDVDNKIYSSGTLLAAEEVEIRNEISGRITSIRFKEGARVKKGDLLVTIYDADFQARLKKLTSQREIIAKTEERQKDLLKVSGISQSEYEQALNEVSSVDADIELIQSEISKTMIRAPFDGIIGLKTVSVGAFLQVNTRIVNIQALTKMKIDFSVPERYRSLIKQDTEISFTTESSDEIYKGKIYAFEPKIDLQTRSVMIRAMCENEDMKLVPGAFVQVEIPLMKEINALLIPTQSIIPELKGQSVFVARNGKAEKVSVEAGSRNDSTILILEGLNAGDTVLTTGMMQVRPGSPLRINVNSKKTGSKI